MTKDVTHQVPPILHDGINAKHHLFALSCAVFEHRAGLNFIQPRLGKDTRTALVRHPYLRIRICQVLHEGFVVDRK